MGMLPAFLAGAMIEALTHGRLLVLVEIACAQVSLGLINTHLANRQAIFSIELTHALGVNLRTSAILRLQRATMLDLSQRTVGELTNRLEGDVEGFVSALLNAVPILTGAFSFAWLAILMPLTDWRLAILGYCVVPLWFMTVAPIAPRIASAGATLAEARDAYMTVLSESVSISGLLRVKTFVRYEKDVKRLLARYAELRVLKQNMNSATRSTVFFQTLVSALAPAIVLIGGAILMVNKQLSLGSLITFTGYFAKVFGSATQLSSISGVSATISYNAQRVLQLFQYTAESRGGTAIHLRGSIEMSDLYFSYESTPIIEAFSASFNAGEKILVMGPSGCGKTTLLRLLTGLYFPDRGNIRFDGVDLAEIELDSLRKQIAYVPQDATLLSGTLLENLTYGVDVCRPDDLESVLQDCMLAEFVAGLPLGLNTLLNGQGATVSGGQRQRIALARALLASPRILLLDEATSAIDTATETAILKNVFQRHAETTIVAVTHRPPAVQGWTRTIELLRKPYDEIRAIPA
jgi:ATP-binding cassette subfamily B protein